MRYQELQRNFLNKIWGEEQRIGDGILKYEIQEIEEAQLRPEKMNLLKRSTRKYPTCKKKFFQTVRLFSEVTAGQNGCAGNLIGLAVQRLYTVSNLDAEARD